MPAILAKKLGMTQVFLDDGRVERVTVLEAGPCPVTGIRTRERDGYEAVQLAFGPVKRHGFSRGPVSHGSHNVRAPGSIGAAAYPARVFKGLRGPGQMGNKRVTQRGLTVVRVDADNNLLLVRGSVPGPRNGVVEVRSDG